jgi:hypothetical protein
MVNQKIVDDVVDGTLKNTLSDTILEQFIKESSFYDDLYTNNETELTSWIRFHDVFDRDELPYWDSYYNLEDFRETEISEVQLKEFSNGRAPNDEEYYSFLRMWVRLAFDNFNFADLPMAAISFLTHSDGRTCAVLVASTEGGQGGWTFEEVFEGLFQTKEDAILYLKENGIIESYNETELKIFLNHFSS